MILLNQNLAGGKANVLASNTGGKRKYSCVEIYDDPKSNAMSKIFSSKQELVKELTASAGLDAKLWGNSVNASTSFKKITSGSETSKGVELSWNSQAYDLQMTYSCKSNEDINPKLLKDWNDLPTDCNTAANCNKFFKFTQ